MSDDHKDVFEAAFAGEPTDVTGPASDGEPATETDEGAPPAAEDNEQLPAASTPPSADQSKPTPAALEPPGAEVDQQTDIWSQATPEQRAAFDAAQKAAKDAEHRYKSREGRESVFQRERDEARRMLRVAQTAANANGPELREYLESAEYKKAKADYGDDLAPLFAAFEVNAMQTENLRETVAQQSMSLNQQKLAQLDAQNLAALTERADDWRELRQDPGFEPWLLSQPRALQEAFNRNAETLVDVDEAVFVFDLARGALRQAQPQTQSDPKRESQLDAARTVKTKAGLPTSNALSDEDAIFEQALKQGR